MTATTPAAPAVAPEWVLADKFRDLTGTTTNTVHQRRKKGVWLDGVHTAVVDRRLYVNIKAADQWIKNQLSQPRPA